MTSLFISYSRKDIDFARKLTQSLDDQDLDFWIDWEGIPPTVDWWKEIKKGIEEADNFLFLISPDSIASEICKQEIEHAIHNGKRLIPIVVRDIKAEEVLAELSHLNWIFFRENDDFNESFEKLITAIKTDYEWVQIHRRLQVRALEWERGNKDNSFLLRGTDLQEAEAQLVANAGKDPKATALQTEYVLKSRQTTDRQRRITTVIAIAGVIVLAALAIFGFVQANLATDNATKAQNQAATAQAASTLAVENEATAVANAEEAQRQADIALARQLSVQAQSVFKPEISQQTIAGLLAIQSLKIYPSLGPAQMLGNSTLPQMVSEMTYADEVTSVAFSPDGKYTLSGSLDGTARVWEATSGVEVARMTHDGYVYSVAFSPDGKYALSGSWDGTARVWEATSGVEVARMIHDGCVYSVAFSPDGKYALSGSLDGTARIWEVTSGVEVARMTHNSYVYSVAFSPDGKYALSGSWDGTARVWEATTGKEVSRMTYGNRVNSLAFSPDGKYVVTGGCDIPLDYERCLEGSARVWDVTTGKEINRLDSDVLTVAFSPDGKYVVSGSQSGIAMVWNAKTGVEISSMTHNREVLSVAFSSDGKYVFSGSADRTARVWLAEKGEEVSRMAHRNWVNSVAFSPDGNYVISGSASGIARVWKTYVSQETARLLHSGPVTSFALSPDGRYIVTGSNDNIVHVWDVETGEEISRMIHENDVTSVAFSSNGRYVLSGSNDKTARFWEVETGEEVVRMTHDSSVISVATSPNGKYAVSVECESEENSCVSGTAHVWELATGKEIDHIIPDSNVSFVAFSPNSKHVISGSLDGTVNVWVVETGQELAHVSHGGRLSSVAISPNGRYIVSASRLFALSLFDHNPDYSFNTRVWEVETGNEIVNMTISTIYEGDAHSFAFSPDGKYIVSVSSNGISNDIRVWETETGEEISRIPFDDNDVTSVAFSPDGDYIMSGSRDNTARVWEVETGEEIARMTHDDWVISVTFSPNGEYAISTSADSTVRVWKWRPYELIDSVCSRLSRNLTSDEWNQYIGETLLYQATCSNLPIDSGALTDIARQTLENTSNPDRIQIAIQRLSDLLHENPNDDNPSDQVKGILRPVIEEQISNSSYSAYTVANSLSLLESAKRKGIEIEDGDTINNICWFGSLNGYAAQVLEYCESAVALFPQNENVRDSRGLARALTGDFEGAKSDFQYYVNNSDRSERVEKRMKWLLELETGRNPFTDELLKELLEE